MMLKNSREFYESYGERRQVNPLETDYDRRAADWKVSVLRTILPQQLEISSVLEFGSGSGFVLRAVSQVLPRTRLIGIDLSKQQISVARATVPQAEFICGDEDTLANLRQTLDIVLLVDILEHLEDPLRVLRVASQAGRFVVTKIPLEDRLIDHLRDRLTGHDPHEHLGIGHHHAGHLVEWDRHDARKLLREAQLEILGEKTADPPSSVRYHPFIVP